MKKTLISIILILTMSISFSVIAFAEGTAFEPLSMPICFGVDIQE